MKRYLILFALLFCVVTTFGQTAVHPFVSADIGLTKNVGYENPLLGGTVGAEITGTHFLTISSVEPRWARKIETGDGVSFRVNNLGFLRWKGLLAGGGVLYSKQYTSAWTKDYTKPEVAIGYDDEDMRFVATYAFVGTDHQNEGHNFSIDGSVKIDQNDHWRWVAYWGWSYAHETDNPANTLPVGFRFSSGIMHLW